MVWSTLLIANMIGPSWIALRKAATAIRTTEYFISPINNNNDIVCNVGGCVGFIDGGIWVDDQAKATEILGWPRPRNNVEHLRNWFKYIVLEEMASGNFKMFFSF